MPPKYHAHPRPHANHHIYIQHTKNQNYSHTNIEYFPHKLRGKEVVALQNESNTSNKGSNGQHSDSSRYLKKQSSMSLTANSTLQENKHLNKKIEHLARQVQKYQRLIAERDDRHAILKVYETELGQTYRVIHYYEGKMAQLQKICKNYETNLLPEAKTSTHQANRGDIVLQTIRKDNVQLKGELQKKNFEINKIINELRKSQAKYFNNEQKVIELNKRISQKQGSDRLKAVNDYERMNLVYKDNQGQPFIKRRPGLTSYKNKQRSRSREGSESSDINSDYKNNIYIKKRESNSSSRVNLNKKGTQAERAGEYLQVSKNRSKRNIKETTQENTSKGNVVLFGNINSKLNFFEKEFETLRKENQELHAQLDSITKQNAQLKHTLAEKAILINGQDNKKWLMERSDLLMERSGLLMERSGLKQIVPLKSNKAEGQKDKLSNYITNFSQKSESSNSHIDYKGQVNAKTYKFKRIEQQTIRQLVINLARQNITYLNMINTLTSLWTSQNTNGLSQFLSQSPCLLAQNQIRQFQDEYDEIMRHIISKENESASKDLNEQEYKKCVQTQIKAIVKDNIEYFKNITIRRDFSLNIQLANKFKNYEEDIEYLVKLHRNRMLVQEGRVVLQRWGLSSEQFLFLLIRNKEEYNDIEYIHFQDLAKYFLMT